MCETDSHLLSFLKLTRKSPLVYSCNLLSASADCMYRSGTTCIHSRRICLCNDIPAFAAFLWCLVSYAPQISTSLYQRLHTNYSDSNDRLPKLLFASRLVHSYFFSTSESLLWMNTALQILEPSLYHGQFSQISSSVQYAMESFSTHFRNILIIHFLIIVFPPIYCLVCIRIA